MGVDQVVLLARVMLQEVLILVGPVLAVAIVVSKTAQGQIRNSSQRAQWVCFTPSS